MSLDVPQQVALLQAACRRLVLRPDEERAREAVLRAIAIAPLLPGPEDATFVRALLDEARSSADALAFRVEGPGCDRLVVCALAAALCRTLTELQSQLHAAPALAAADFESHL